MIKKTIHRAASSQTDTNFDKNATPFVGFPSVLNIPLQPTLFEIAPDSDLADLIGMAAQLASFDPSILESIADDLTAHAMAKRQRRGAHRRWIEEQTETLVDVAAEQPGRQELQTGRPRMEPIVVLAFLLLRGSFGCSCKDRRLRVAVEESISLRIFLENRGCSLPGGSTLEENLNAVSNRTREQIHRAELALALDEKLDDFKMIRGDSTAVDSASAYPTDSSTIAKLLCRMCSRLENLQRMGLEPCSLTELTDWKKEINQLKFRLDTINSSSAKQAEMAARKDGSAQSLEVQAGKKEGAKERLRRELYEELYARGEEILPRLEEQVRWLNDQIQDENCPPKEQGRREQFLKEFEDDLEAAKRGIEYSRERVCEGKKPSAKIGKMPWSVSDPSASFIEKGGREKTFGYRPQLSFSASNLVTALIVPEGNAADQTQFIPLLKATIENTGVVPEVVSVDDGYTGTENLRESQGLGVKLVSFSGARGRLLLGDEKWNSESYRKARQDRNGAESGISVLKAMQGFEELGRTGIEGVRGEQLEKVISYNALKIVTLRKRRYEKEHKKRWNTGLPAGSQEVA